MAVRDKVTNKSKFVTGALPTEQDFADMIDSYQDVLVVPTTSSIVVTPNSGGGATISLTEIRAGLLTHLWRGTQDQYDAITSKNDSTIYFITE